MKKLLSLAILPAVAARLLFAATLGALLAALVAQYAFDIQPCVLCLWQRVPLSATALLALIAAGKSADKKLADYLFYAMAGLSLCAAGIALFHTGVEQHWWLGTSGCTVQALSGDAAVLRESLLKTAVARCDQITWSLLGLSLANWNIPFSLALAAYAFVVVRYGRKA